MARLRPGLYGAAHFLVDFGCALLLLGRICPEWDPAAAILLYNFLAFAVQMPIGLLADRYGRCHMLAAAGCLLVASGRLLPPGPAAIMAAGLGNAVFHVGGGLHTLNESGNRAGPLGVFVSPGAFGVYLGGVMAAAGKSVSDSSGVVPGPAVSDSFGAVPGLFVEAMLPWAVCLALVLLAVLLWRFGRGQKTCPWPFPGEMSGCGAQRHVCCWW